MYTIDKNIPIPADAGRRGTPRKYPFPDMRVGDSLFFADAPMEGREVQAARTYFKRAGWTLVARRVDGGVRVWRAA